MILILYVDVRLSSGGNRFKIDSIKLEFSNQFNIKNVETSIGFLGIKALE